MIKCQVLPSIPVLQSTEVDNPPSKQTAQSEGVPADRSNKWTTDRIMTTARQHWQQLDWSLVWMILAVKGIIFVFGVQSHLSLMNKPIERWYGWLEIWNRWDSLRHIRLAQIGYTGVGSDRADLIGFPLYPWLVWLFALIFPDYLVSAFIVSGLALIAAGLLLHKLVLTDFPDSVARNSVWFMLIFPTAYFLHINYNESLFIALTLGCFLAARQEHWSLAGILGIFLCLTRLNGLVIIPALLMEVILQYRASRRWQWQWLWVLAPFLGFGIYLLLNQYAAGDAFAFIAVGRENFQKSLSVPWDGIRGVYNLMWSPEISHAQMVGVQEFVFIVLGAVCTVACGFLLRPSYTVWMAGNWLLFTSSGFILSVPRYTLVMFPIFILFARLAERRFWNSVITVWSLLLLAFFVTKFVQGHWAF
ncbi:MAG: glycosyltransferase family 39 protein [Acidobacteria bacterium]|jgi:hypothetical protein|nr:glycosyltransferase family 39 protein [Acidobacteriota bacterium]